MSLALLVPFCVFVTAAISGVLGMAGGMILMGCLISLLPVAAAITLHAAAQFVSNGSRALLHHRHIVWRPLRFYVLGLAAATALMCVISFIPDKATVFLLLGLLPFAQMGLARRVQLDIEKPFQAIVCGFLSTLLHLAGGVAGMLLDVFFQRTNMTRHQIVSTKAASQTLSHTVRFFYFTLLAQTATESALPPWQTMIAVIIASIAGTSLSSRLLARMSDANFRRITQIVLLILGVVYLGRAVMLYLS